MSTKNDSKRQINNDFNEYKNQEFDNMNTKVINLTSDNRASKN